MEKTLIRWIMAMLSNTLLMVNLLRVIRTGLVDRARVLPPPILWNMTVDDLLMKLNGAGCLAIGYADDIALLFSEGQSQKVEIHLILLVDILQFLLLQI